MRALTGSELELYDHVPGTDALRTRIALVPWLQPGTHGMTLGRLVLLRRDHAGDTELIAHELVHVHQWRELGAVRFLIRYIAAYLRGLVQYRNHRLAYRAIPAEREARAEAAAWAARRRLPR